MTSKERLNLSVDEGIGDLLSKLAGGERKRGDYLSNLLRSIDEGEDVTGLDVESLRLMVQGLGGRLKSLEGELMRMRSQLAAIIASKAV
jgi:hypothetical protein